MFNIASNKLLHRIFLQYHAFIICIYKVHPPIQFLVVLKKIVYRRLGMKMSKPQISHILDILLLIITMCDIIIILTGSSISSSESQRWG